MGQRISYDQLALNIMADIVNSLEYFQTISKEYTMILTLPETKTAKENQDLLVSTKNKGTFYYQNKEVMQNVFHAQLLSLLSQYTEEDRSKAVTLYYYNPTDTFLSRPNGGYYPLEQVKLST